MSSSYPPNSIEAVKARDLPPTGEATDVILYLQRKEAHLEGIGIVRLSKALKWYFFYICLVLMAIFLFSLYPKIVSVLLTLNTVVVISIFVVNYGLVAISYLASSWPRSNGDATRAREMRADGDAVLSYIEKILNVAHVILFMVFFPAIQSGWSLRKHLLIYAIFQSPRLITFFSGFPRKYKALQVLIILVRLVSLFGEFLVIAYIIYNYFARSYDSALITCALLGGVPLMLFYALFLRGLLLNKLFDNAKEDYFVGHVQRRWVLFVVFQLCAMMWAASIGLMQLIFLPKLPIDPNHYGKPTWEIFLVLCSAVFLAIFTIAALYYSTLSIPRDRLKSHYRFGNMPVREFLNLNKGYETIPDHSPIVERETEGPGNESDFIDEENNPKYRFMQHISLVIACHESEPKIRETLRGALSAGFMRRNIFIAHNARQSSPIDGTGVCTWQTNETRHPHGGKRSTSDFHGVRYVYIPIGNKTVALHYVIKNYVTTPLVMIIDDDVVVPSNIDMEGAFNRLQEVNMKAIAFTIRGIDGANIWQSFQHLEYMQAGFVKIFQADYGSVLTCHGAIALWKTDTICDVLLEHNTEFDGEDLQMGLILRRMGKGYTIGVNAVEPVPTTSPRSLLWEPIPKEKSLMVQRIFSWDMAAHHYFFDFFEMLMLNWEKNSLVLKPFLFTELWTQFQDWLRIVFLADLIISKETNHLVEALGVLLGIQLVLVFIFDRVVIAHRPMLQISGALLLFYPVYNIITLIFRFGGLLVNVFYYTPWNPPRISIRERVDRGELPPKVEIDKIPDDKKAEYWNTVWRDPQEAAKLITYQPDRIRE